MICTHQLKILYLPKIGLSLLFLSKKSWQSRETWPAFIFINKEIQKKINHNLFLFKKSLKGTICFEFMHKVICGL